MQFIYTIDNVMRTCFPINKVLYHLISTKVDSSQSHFIFLHFFWLSTWVAEIQKQKLQLAAIELFFFLPIRWLESDIEKQSDLQN